MRSGVPTPPRPRRRALGLLVAGLALTGAALTGCSDNEPADPAISGDSPAEVTVPTVPPSTTEASDDLELDQDDAEAPGTGVETGTTTVPPAG